MIRTNITNRAEAQEAAIEWQEWMSQQNLSLGEMIEWSNYFSDLASRFDLFDEFVENGII